MRAAARALLLVAGLGAGCHRSSALEGVCDADGDCPAGYACVALTGLCVSFTTPLAPDGGSDAPPQVADAAADAKAAPVTDGAGDAETAPDLAAGGGG